MRSPNSGGGVVVWGIRADRDGVSGIDAVQEEVPVPDVERLAHKLKEWQPPATDAPVAGVIVQPILLPGSAKEGFVVCLIPESNSKPHRSEFGKGDVKRFYMRIGGLYPGMHRANLAAAFLPAPFAQTHCHDDTEGHRPKQRTSLTSSTAPRTLCASSA